MSRTSVAESFSTLQFASHGWSHRAGRVVIWSVLLVAAALRLWAAAPNPGPKRFWDERYLVANTARVLTDGWTSPQNVYYPGLGHAPTTLLLRVGDALGVLDLDAVVVSRRQLGANGYRVARAVSVGWALAGIVFVYLLGRRLSARRNPWVGLTAASLLAFVPWYLRQSILYKPDIALCALVAGSLWACLRLEERTSYFRWSCFFLLPALAFCAKWNAAPLLLPMGWVLWRRLDGQRERGRRISWRAALLGLVLGLATLLALNPTVLTDPSSFQRDLSKTATHYEGRAAKAAASHWQMPVHAVTSLLSNDYLGPFLGGASWIGLVWLCWGAVDRVYGWRLLALWTAAYVGVYSVATAYPSPHNWMPLLPVLCLTAAGAAARLFGRFERRRLASLVLLALFAAGLTERTGRTLQLAHREAVPTSGQVAEGLLGERLGTDFAGRMVVSDVLLHDRLRGFATQSRTLDPRHERLLVLSPAEASGGELPDGVVWRPAGRGSCETERALELLGGAPIEAGIEAVRPGIFRARGDRLCVATSSWRRAESGDNDGTRPQGAMSASVDLVHAGATDGEEAPARVLWRAPDGRLLASTPCVPLRHRGQRVFCRTARLALPARAEPVLPAVDLRRVSIRWWAPANPTAATVATSTVGSL